MRPKYSSTSFRWSGPYCWYKEFDKDPNEAIMAVSSAGVLYDGTPIKTFLGLGKAENSGADVRDDPEGLNGISDIFLVVRMSCRSSLVSPMKGMLEMVGVRFSSVIIHGESTFSVIPGPRPGQKLPSTILEQSQWSLRRKPKKLLQRRHNFAELG